MLRLTTLNPMAHLTCTGHSRLELADILVDLQEVRGRKPDGPGGRPSNRPLLASRASSFHALELVELARAIGGFCIGVAAHPSGHPRSLSMVSDRRFLVEKLRVADFAVTQFFFEVSDYFSLVDDVEAIGLSKPVLPGIMPVTNLSSIPRMAEMGCAVPSWLVERLEEADRAGRAAKTWSKPASTQLPSCAPPLLDKGAPGLHFYTFNRSEATRQNPLRPRFIGSAAPGSTFRTAYKRHSPAPVIKASFGAFFDGQSPSGAVLYVFRLIVHHDDRSASAGRIKSATFPRPVGGAAVPGEPFWSSMMRPLVIRIAAGLSSTRR